MRFAGISTKKLAHYASEAYDVEYNFKSWEASRKLKGFMPGEIGNLSQHSKFSGVELDYFDEKTGEKFISPHYGTSADSIGMFLMFIDQAYTEEKSRDKTESGAEI